MEEVQLIGLEVFKKHIPIKCRYCEYEYDECCRRSNYCLNCGHPIEKYVNENE